VLSSALDREQRQGRNQPERSQSKSGGRAGEEAEGEEGDETKVKNKR